MPRHRTITLLLALLLGVGAGWMLWPRWQAVRALAAIASPSAESRASGWSWLGTTAPRTGRTRAERHLDAMNTRLTAGPDDALRDGANALRGLGLWSWSHQDDALIVRELALLASSGDPGAELIAAEALLDAPLELDETSVGRLAPALLGATDAGARATAMKAVLRWAGPSRTGVIAALAPKPEDVALWRQRDLALGWSEPPPPDDAATPPGLDAPVDLVESRLLLRTSTDPLDASAALVLLDAWPPDEAGHDARTRPAFEYVLRHSADPRAKEALETLARDGNRAARFALHARERHVDTDRARAAVTDPAASMASRRIAAWRWDGVPVSLVRSLLEHPADDDGSVCGVVLLAERRLPRAEAAALAEQWIRSFDDDEKRAGALLAATLGAHRELVESALVIEDQPAVRTTQRLALWALGAPIGDDDPLEFAHRTLHDPDGGFDPDTALCMLRAGRPETLALLTSRPGPDRRAVQTRAWLVERFVPSWHERAGRPTGGSQRGLGLHFDRLDALRLLTERRLPFDPDRAIFVPLAAR